MEANMIRVARALLLATIALAPLTAQSVGPESYRLVATLPDVTDKWALAWPTFDPVTRRLYVMSGRGLYFADVSAPAVTWTFLSEKKNLGGVQISFSATPP